MYQPASQTARAIVNRALQQSVACFPDLQPVSLELDGLHERDRHLALAIYRVVIQRWLSIHHVLERLSTRRLSLMEPALQAILMSGAAQLLFFSRLPAYAVVHESVELASAMIRPGAGRIVNAILRKVSNLVDQIVEDDSWSMRSNQLPVVGGYLVLKQAVFPDPQQEWIRYLSLAGSHPQWLVKRWLKCFGREVTTSICLHHLMPVPTIVAVGTDFNCEAVSPDWQAHDVPGFVVWRGSYQGLKAFLDQDPNRRVQDPSSSYAVRETAGLSVHRILDYCAGRGTKTRQILNMHTEAEVTAWEVDIRKRADLLSLRELFPDIRIAEHEQSLDEDSFDLVVVDVPCSNSGVLGRRPEAKYRLNQKSLESLIMLQRDILKRASELVKSGGYILYSTCSVEEEENAQQISWFLEQCGAQKIAEHIHLPGGVMEKAYHDGAYFALARVEK